MIPVIPVLNEGAQAAAIALLQEVRRIQRHTNSRHRGPKSITQRTSELFAKFRVEKNVYEELQFTLYESVIDVLLHAETIETDTDHILDLMIPSILGSHGVYVQPDVIKFALGLLGGDQALTVWLLHQAAAMGWHRDKRPHSLEAGIDAGNYELSKARSLIEKRQGKGALFAKAVTKKLESQIGHDSKAAAGLRSQFARMQTGSQPKSETDFLILARLALQLCQAIRVDARSMKLRRPEKSAAALKEAIEKSSGAHVLSVEEVAYFAALHLNRPMEKLLEYHGVQLEREDMFTYLQRRVAGQTSIVERICDLLDEQLSSAKSPRFVWLFYGKGGGKSRLATCIGEMLGWKTSRQCLIPPAGYPGSIAVVNEMQPGLVILDFADFGTSEDQAQYARVLGEMLTSERPQVSGSYQLEAGGQTDLVFGPRDLDMTGLERLAQHIEHTRTELRQLIEE